ncbi:MAG: hypothetical protein L6R41_004908 [Letrouitia leprolyta]|nr:MAG: hypothetical protein L6R41_004908 [Letrouitia leprolyta]
MDQLPHFTDIRPHFGASNPPPRIWTARENILRNQGTEADFTNVAGFIRAHSVEWTSAEKQHALKLQEIRNQELNQEIEMEDLVEDMDDVEIRKEPYIPSQRPFGIFTDEPPDSIHNSGVLDVTPPPPTSVFGSETDTDREIDEQLKEAFLEMEWEDTQEAAARMDITDDAEKENDAPAQLDAPGYDKGGQPLQELMEDAHRICVEIGEELARNGDYADNSDDML